MHKTRKCFNYILFLLGSAFCMTLALPSCKDENVYDDKDPDFLKESIYGYLQQKGEFNYFLKIIDEMGYKDVLQKTGSKTLFVAKDESFNRFFNENSYGIKSFEAFSKAQKASILNFGMINNAYLLEMLPNTTGNPPVQGQALRRLTAMTALDSLAFESGSYLPDNAYWTRFREKGIHVMNDNTNPTMVHFTTSQMQNKGITNADFSFIFNGKSRVNEDVNIFGLKVLSGADNRDIACKNGYVNVLENLLFPPVNMAQYIRTCPRTTIFNRLMQRFCAPYYDPENTYKYHAIHPEFQDSVFTKSFFTASYHPLDPNGKPITNLLTYDPGDNLLPDTKGNFQTDMGAMFVPSDEAMNQYFNTGKGKFLKDRYGSWDNIPDNIAAIFVNNHMKSSFVEAVPSKFPTVKNSAGYAMGVQQSDIDQANTYVACNGVVYVTNAVYPPTEYASVMAPVLVNENMKVFNWAIAQLQFNLYLLSMDSKKFSFLVPVDDYLTDYVDPVAQGYVTKQVLKFYYDDKTSKVYAKSYDTSGQLIGTITDQTIILNRLQDILDYHIVVGDIEDGKQFYMTKGGGEVRVSGTGPGMKVYGGGNIERADGGATVNAIQLADNGKTYMISRQLQNPLRSVYSVLKNNAQFSEFFKLLNGVGSIFANNIGLDYNVKFFNTYHYTIYVPTNDAVLKAISDGIIPSLDEIDSETDLAVQTAKRNKLERFLRYHFQDNSIYLDNNPYAEKEYETATLNTSTQKFYTLKVGNTGSQAYVKTASGQTVEILKTDGAYTNIMARDYTLDNADKTKAKTIETSSRAVIQQVGTVLRFE